MKLDKLHEITFDTEEAIMAAALSSPGELAMMMGSGEVIRYKINKQEVQYLFSVKSKIEYADGGFDINAESSIYTLGDIVVVVNDYKTHGFIHYPGKYHALRLWRKDYHADISNYPIALFKDESGVPHIIYGEAWNHVQIMNLDTRQVLTAAKSLIEENAEERHVEFYKTYSEDNKLPWPSPYDYFYGKLLLSPDQKKFLSAGWAWGSFDAYNVYDIYQFIASNRIAEISIGGWEHENRAACWVDKETVAVAYHPLTEGDDGATADSPCEIHFYRIEGNEASLQTKLQAAHTNFVRSEMYFNAKLNAFIIFSDTIGLLVLSKDGKMLLEDKSIKIESYHEASALLLTRENHTMTVYSMAG
jgi:hypothetical protein